MSEESHSGLIDRHEEAPKYDAGHSIWCQRMSASGPKGSIRLKRNLRGGLGDEAAAGEIIDKCLVDRRAIELKVSDVLGEGKLGDGELVLDRSRLLLADLGRECHSACNIDPLSGGLGVQN